MQPMPKAAYHSNFCEKHAYFYSVGSILRPLLSQISVLDHRVVFQWSEKMCRQISDSWTCYRISLDSQ